MKLLEYEAKAILQRYGIAVPQGEIARTPEEAAAIARRLDKLVFLKAQITVAGRGKAGGILPAENAEEAANMASKLIGSKIKDVTVNSVLVEEKLVEHTASRRRATSPSPRRTAPRPWGLR